MGGTDVEIRRFESSDLEMIQEIRAAAFAPVFRSFREIVGERIAATAFAKADAEQAELLAGLSRPRSNHELFVARRDNVVVGFISYSLDHETKIGEIGLNAVHPDHAGRGIGTQLYDFAIDRMKAAGMRVATVGTGGDPSHAPARRAYAKAGFGPSIPSAWMYKLL